jgi:TetR/AcrR family transcriptional regulator, repressor for neighboring sulfatase
MPRTISRKGAPSSPPASRRKASPHEAPSDAGKAPRTRRDPTVAKELILEAAATLFGEKGPDSVGLKDVALRAEVSQALVTHYFGTYDGLVEAVIERRFSRAGTAITGLLAGLDSTGPDADFFTQLAAMAVDPIALRLAAWVLLSGRYRGTKRGATFGVLARLVDALELVGQARGARDTPREELEFGVLASLTMLLGYETAKTALLEALGRSPSESFDTAFRMHMLQMLAMYLSRNRTTAP